MAPSPRKCANGALCGTGAKTCNLSLFLGGGLDGGDGKLSIMSIVRNVSDGCAAVLWPDCSVSCVGGIEVELVSGIVNR